MAVTFLVAVFVMRFIFQRLIMFLENGSILFFSLEENDFLNNLSGRIYQSFKDTIFLLVLLFLSLIISAIFAGAMQTKFLLSFKPLKMDLKRINPIEGFKRFFSMRSLFELLKSILKMVIVGFVAYSVIRSNWILFRFYSDMETVDSLKLIFNLTYEVMLKCAIALFILAIVDYFYQRWEFEKSIRMTKQEIKEEYREIEGSPEVRRRQREIMARLARGRMLQQVPEADVVITNPSHIAVAIEYKSEEMEAPVVLAKGADEIAQKIIQIAKENNIPVVRNPQVARELYKTTDIGEQIPPNMYRAVAEILAYVYSLR
ncbi:MAG: flagellar biosynthesis protein FlhB [Pseudothermotoga sp.]|nr:flagellar biosynthesis protein FlhB [Pseudothermotoga sp.]